MSFMGQGKARSGQAPIELISAKTDAALGGLIGKIARLKRESETGHLTIAFSSPTSGGGSSTMATACALSLARNLGQENALVELSLQSPAVARYLGIDGEPGLRELLLGEATLDEALKPTLESRLHVIPAGQGTSTRAALLASPEFKKAHHELLKRFGVVILDTPPILTHADSGVALDGIDGLILIVGARRTKQRAVEQTVERFRELGTPVLGMVMNRYRSDMPFGLGDPDT